MDNYNSADWAALLKQARFSAILSLSYFVLWLVVGFVVWRIHKYLNTNSTFLYRHLGELTRPYDHYKPAPYLMAVFVLYWATVFVLSCIYLIPDFWAGFFNPAFWALKHY